MEIQVGDLQANNVVDLLQEHLSDMYATSPAESVHALDLSALKNKDITFWTAGNDNNVLGCIALKELDKHHGEIKSMRTARKARNQGVGKALLLHVLHVARSRSYQKISLETGTMAFFEPARALYKSYGFEDCGPFANYPLDPNSCFMSLILKPNPPC